MDIATRDQVIANIRKLLAATKDQLPPENVKDAEELLEHGEWGESLDLICTQLYEFGVTLSQELYRMVEQSGLAMNLDAERWSYLKELFDQGTP